MTLNVNVVCRNYKADRVLPRFARYLRDGLGWTLTPRALEDADVVYLMGYFEAQLMKPWPGVPVAAYFTHYEELPKGNGKAKYFDAMAERLQLRVATAPMYADYLQKAGPSVCIPPPVERDRFVIPRGRRTKNLVAGFSGYTYKNHRKGEDLARLLMKSKAAQGFQWRASGRGWPVPMKKYAWKEMPSFYQGLDVLVVTSRVEGVPLPPLEALSCGVSVVVPRGVGLLDELPNVRGIHRYERGNIKDLIKAVGKARAQRGDVDRKALRAVTEKYTPAGWCAGHKQALEELAGGLDAGLAAEERRALAPLSIAGITDAEPEDRGTQSKRGIYVVAYGDQARTCALRLMKSSKKHMPEIPIALSSDRKIGPEDILVVQEDSDIGGRRAKLRAYSLAPAEWDSILYLDADTEVVGDIRFFFQLIDDGWEFVICKDPHLMDTMHAFRRRNNLAELAQMEQEIFTLHTLQYNGGVWAFGRNARIRRFFKRWLAEWERHAQRDQGALIRAMYTEPLRTYVLGNEWNTFTKYTKGITTAGLRHHVGQARRWRGQIPGRIDSAAAWSAVKKFEARQRVR